MPLSTPSAFPVRDSPRRTTSVPTLTTLFSTVVADVTQHLFVSLLNFSHIFSGALKAPAETPGPQTACPQQPHSVLCRAAAAGSSPRRIARLDPIRFPLYTCCGGSPPPTLTPAANAAVRPSNQKGMALPSESLTRSNRGSRGSIGGL